LKVYYFSSLFAKGVMLPEESLFQNLNAYTIYNHAYNGNKEEYDILLPTRSFLKSIFILSLVDNISIYMDQNSHLQ